MVEVNHSDLNSETLKNLLREIVLREGTEYGAIEYSTETKVEQLLNALENGKAAIMFDTEQGFCDIISK